MLAGFQSFSNVQPSTYITIPFSRYTFSARSVLIGCIGLLVLFRLLHVFSRTNIGFPLSSTQWHINIRCFHQLQHWPRCRCMYLCVCVYYYVQLAIATICASFRSFSSSNVHSTHYRTAPRCAVALAHSMPRKSPQAGQSASRM
jgi:hypothetical protein